MKDIKSTKIILLYTMPYGLGDYLIIGNIMRKAERLLPNIECWAVHRNNPHVCLWPGEDAEERFFNVFSFSQCRKLLRKLRTEKLKKTVIFGLQMAPGSVQGFLLLSLLKKMRMIDYVVDFNLINADIITPPTGEYILDIHLNQIKKLLNIEIPEEMYKMELPVKNGIKELPDRGRPATCIGIHPWTRKEQSCFRWPFEKWAKVVEFLVKDERSEVVIFGRDKKFNEFRKFLQNFLGERYDKIKFTEVDSVEGLIETIANLDMIVSVNTAVVHIGYALKKKMVILGGPTLSIWSPKGQGINIICDDDAVFPGSDSVLPDSVFPNVARISPEKVIKVMEKVLN